jgi:hypothetical protein
MLKEHISYSELKQWKDCGWRHKLIYIDKLQTFEESPHLHYGTIIHDACEHYLKTKQLKLKEVEDKIIETWDVCGFDSDDFVILQTNRALLDGWTYKHEKVDKWVQWAKAMISALPGFLESTFPEWEYVAAEESLYEDINNTEVSFKGFIDCVIKVPTKGKYKYWILDWKTASGRGWSTEKKRDFTIQSQVILYKHFWGLKHNVEMKDINCGFVLLKKVTKQEKACQLLKVSAGPVMLERSQKMISNMLKTLDKKMFLKNKNNCKFCEFRGTEHCK